MFNATEEYKLAPHFPHVRLMIVSDVESNETLYDVKKYDMHWSHPSKGNYINWWCASIYKGHTKNCFAVNRQLIIKWHGKILVDCKLIYQIMYISSILNKGNMSNAFHVLRDSGWLLCCMLVVWSPHQCQAWCTYGSDSDCLGRYSSWSMVLCWFAETVWSSVSTPHFTLFKSLCFACLL